jgi:hypothetical protein|tara:strand:+ start:2457 stop:2636 length:180 start_codon:yes stop_codon:yes gene_type:complete
MDSAMDELNDLIGCFEEELRDIRRDNEMSLSQKVISLRKMATMLNQERVDQWLYREANP